MSDTNNFSGTYILGENAVRAYNHFHDSVLSDSTISDIEKNGLVYTARYKSKEELDAFEEGLELGVGYLEYDFVQNDLRQAADVDELNGNIIRKKEASASPQQEKTLVVTVYTIVSDSDGGTEVSHFGSKFERNKHYENMVRAAWERLNGKKPMPIDPEEAYDILVDTPGFLDTFHCDEQEFTVSAQVALDFAKDLVSDLYQFIENGEQDQDTFFNLRERVRQFVLTEECNVLHTHEVAKKMQLQDGDLDDLVHDLYAAEATEINNGGICRQLSCLLIAGVNEGEISEKLNL